MDKFKEMQVQVWWYSERPGWTRPYVFKRNRIDGNTFFHPVALSYGGNRCKTLILRVPPLLCRECWHLFGDFSWVVIFHKHCMQRVFFLHKIEIYLECIIADNVKLKERCLLYCYLSNKSFLGSPFQSRQGMRTDIHRESVSTSDCSYLYSACIAGFLKALISCVVLCNLN